MFGYCIIILVSREMSEDKVNCGHREHTRAVKNLAHMLDRGGDSEYWITLYLAKGREYELSDQITEYVGTRRENNEGPVDEKLLNAVAECLCQLGLVFTIDTIYENPGKNKEKIKDQQREAIIHIRDTCGHKEYIEELEVICPNMDLLDYISAGRKYWVLIGDLKAVLTEDIRNSRIYDHLFGCIPIWERRIKNVVLINPELEGEPFDSDPQAYLFPDGEVTPRELCDFAVCYKEHLPFRTILYTEHLYIDVKAKDILNLDIAEVVDISPFIVELATAILSNNALSDNCKK